MELADGAVLFLRAKLVGWRVGWEEVGGRCSTTQDKVLLPLPVAQSRVQILPGPPSMPAPLACLCGVMFGAPTFSTCSKPAPAPCLCSRSPAGRGGVGLLGLGVGQRPREVLCMLHARTHPAVGVGAPLTLAGAFQGVSATTTSVRPGCVQSIHTVSSSITDPGARRGGDPVNQPKAPVLSPGSQS